MTDLKHATKKRFAKTLTRKKTIESGVSAEFTDYRKKLQAAYNAVKTMIKEIRATREAWQTVSKHQSAFSEALVAALPVDGVVRTHAREVDNTARKMHHIILENEAPTDAHLRIVGVLEGYLSLLQAIKDDYPDVETSFTEVRRYQRKVEKLTKKAPKKQESLTRNLEKLNVARGEHDAKLLHIIPRMSAAYEKHEAVFQCAHHAFWISQDKFITIVNNSTHAIRLESAAVRDHLVNIDINTPAKLPPVPRAQAILPPPVSAEIIAPTVEYYIPPVATHAPTVYEHSVRPSHMVDTPHIPASKPAPANYGQPVQISHMQQQNYAAAFVAPRPLEDAASSAPPVVHFPPEASSLPPPISPVANIPDVPSEVPRPPNNTAVLPPPTAPTVPTAPIAPTAPVPTAIGS